MQLNSLIYGGVVLIVALFVGGCRPERVIKKIGIFSSDTTNIIFVEEHKISITEKETQSGVTHTKGFSENYLKSIDAETGDVAHKIKIGTGVEQLHYLGAFGGSAWFYSRDSVSSLHTRNPKTLAIEHSFKKINKLNNGALERLTTKLKQIGYDDGGRNIVVTTYDGDKFLIDASTLIATHYGGKINNYGLLHPHLMPAHIALPGDSLYYQFVGKGILNIAFSKSPIQETGKYELLKKDEYTDLIFFNPKFIANRHYKTNDTLPPLLIGSDSSFYVLSASNATERFSWLITSVQLNKTIKAINWQLELNKNLSETAENTPLMDAACIDGRLILAFENLLLAIDIKTGKLLWHNKTNSY